MVVLARVKTATRRLRRGLRPVVTQAARDDGKCPSGSFASHLNRLRGGG